jgi:hypothetical protein
MLFYNVKSWFGLVVHKGEYVFCIRHIVAIAGLAALAVKLLKLWEIENLTILPIINWKSGTAMNDDIIWHHKAICRGCFYKLVALLTADYVVYLTPRHQQAQRIASSSWYEHVQDSLYIWEWIHAQNRTLPEMHTAVQPVYESHNSNVFGSF